MRLLRGIGSSLTIRSLLLPFGFTRRDLDEGWQLLQDACGIVDGEGDGPTVDSAEALRELDAWDERGFTLVRATVTHRFPPQALFLLAGLEGRKGRPPRSASRRCSIGWTRSRRIRTVKRRARTISQPSSCWASAASGTTSERGSAHSWRSFARRPRRATESTRTEEGNHLARVSRLRAWYDEWSTICRAAVRRPEHLVKLGLAGTRAG